MHPTHTPVLIIGGGLAGLSAALFLAWRGVPCVLVERHPGSSPHPRAIGFTTRTLELFRAVGVDALIPQSPAGHGRPRRVNVESLAGEWHEEAAWTPAKPTGTPHAAPRFGYSPVTGVAIAQDTLEPILRDRARALGADLRLNTKLVAFEQDAAGVTASLRRSDGHEYTLRADYMIAADGHASPIRDALGIARRGHGFMHIVRSILFRADLAQYLASGISQFELNHPDLKGMITTYQDGRWLLMTWDDEPRDEAAQLALLHRALGRTDLNIEIITTGRWVLSALIADHFSSGRIFLAGDAAHTLPPARGGYGANTGIEDAFNLAWKLDAVISGGSSPLLLNTYDAERRPIAWLRHDQIFARQDYAAVATDAERQVAIIEDDAIELGQLYRSHTILGVDAQLPPAQRPEQWAGQPGTRAQHLMVTHDGQQRSTLDLLQRGWHLIAQDPRWHKLAAQVSAATGVPLASLALEPPRDPPLDPATFDEELRAALGIGADGASLIRPDGYIAWRTHDMPADPLHALTSALSRAACAARVQNT
jgi:putative polyketide hydroxylase